MGLYINPATQTKEKFLAEKGTEVEGPITKSTQVAERYFSVCLVNNVDMHPPFSAAGVVPS